MAYGTRVKFEEVREVAFGSITSNYTAVGSPLTDHARIIRLNNQTDVQVYISLDGSINHIRMAANSFLLLDFSANKIRDDGLFASVGTQFYIKEEAASAGSGSFWIEVISASGGI